MLTFARAACATATLLLAVFVAACGGASSSSVATGGALESTAPLESIVPAVSAAASAAGDAAATCRALSNLKDLDYAFGAGSFAVIQALDAASKARTVTDLTTFAAGAPPELRSAATDLVAFWTALAADPSSVTADDPRLTGATATLKDWMTANCS
ncbi:MAG TPA: hypothetical protein VGK16_16030 [Candidatus Limnocylindrales bacterium]|jgi:hypothetical protein